MPDNIKALHGIAKELETLPERGDSIRERAESAGRLLMDAIQCGWRNGPEWVPFRSMIQQRAEQKRVNGYVSAWSEATWMLDGKPKLHRDLERSFPADCRAVAAAIRATAGNRTDDDDVATDTVDKPTLAIAVLFQEPTITPTELAKRVGVKRGTLYSKSPKWKAVRETLTARSPDAPRGRKTNDSIEAEADYREFHPTDDE